MPLVKSILRYQKLCCSYKNYIVFKSNYLKNKQQARGQGEFQHWLISRVWCKIKWSCHVQSAVCTVTDGHTRNTHRVGETEGSKGGPPLIFPPICLCCQSCSLSRNMTDILEVRVTCAYFDSDSSGSWPLLDAYSTISQSPKSILKKNDFLLWFDFLLSSRFYGLTDQSQ